MKNSHNNLTISFLTGTWENEFIDNGKQCSEICEIDAGGRYYVDGEHWFNVVDFKYNGANSEISFIKSAVKPSDGRSFYNAVTIVNSNLLVNNTEDDLDVNSYSVA